MRMFYAVEFTDSVKEALYKSLYGIKEYTLRGSFTEKNNFHITLVFVGECEPEKIEDLQKVTDNAVTKLNPAPIKAVIDRLGTFARPGDELLWAGVKTEPENILGEINRVILKELAECGITLNSSNQKFKPHVTMARRVQFRETSKEDIKQIKFEPINFTINSLTLMESVQEIKIYGGRRNTKIIYKPVYKKKFL